MRFDGKDHFLRETPWVENQAKKEADWWLFGMIRQLIGWGENRQNMKSNAFHVSFYLHVFILVVGFLLCLCNLLDGA